MQSYSYTPKITFPELPQISGNCLISLMLEDEAKNTTDLRPYLDKKTGYLYVLAEDGKKILASKDGGRSFQVVFENAAANISHMLKISDGFLLWESNSGNWMIRDDDFKYLDTISGSGITKTLLTHELSVDYKESEGIIMYADYNVDSKKVWRSTDNGRSFQEVFYDADVRHWHSCQIDPFTGDWWITSGDTEDTPGEITKIYKSIDDGDSWVFIDGGDRKLKGIRLVFTRDKIMWGTDEDHGKSNVMVTPRDVWNPVSIAQLDAAVLGNQPTANGLCMMHTRSEPNNDEKDMGRIYLTDGVTVKEVFSYHNPIPNANGFWGFMWTSKVDRWNRVWLAGRGVGLFCVSLPFTIS